MDNEHRLTWDQYALQISTLDVSADNVELYYWACKLPWPLTNRDYVCFRKGKIDKSKVKDSKIQI